LEFSVGAVAHLILKLVSTFLSTTSQPNNTYVVVSIAFVEPSITETLLENELVTYILFVSGLTATPCGHYQQVWAGLGQFVYQY